MLQELAGQVAGTTSGKSKDKLVSLLKLSGFVDISEVRGSLSLHFLSFHFLIFFYMIN